MIFNKIRLFFVKKKIYKLLLLDYLFNSRALLI